MFEFICRSWKYYYTFICSKIFEGGCVDVKELKGIAYNNQKKSWIWGEVEEKWVFLRGDFPDQTNNFSKYPFSNLLIYWKWKRQLKEFSVIWVFCPNLRLLRNLPLVNKEMLAFKITNEIAGFKKIVRASSAWTNRIP
jgi:hypothetical protein